MTTTLNATPVAAQPFTITPFARLGAEITGLDLRLPVNNADFARIHQAHLDHHVVVFRDQKITPRQQIDFQPPLRAAANPCAEAVPVA